jgi:L-malate glycosyltransferase
LKRYDPVKILFIEPYPTEGPSSRYRVEQYVPYLKDKGADCAIRPFVSSGFYKILYKKGFYLKKAFFFLRSCLGRMSDFIAAFKYDVIFIHLEAFPLGPPVLEWIWAKAGKKIIYDLDDAIYMGVTSPANRFLKCLKFPGKVKTILRLSKHVITCNEYLADYAAKYNKNITVIHTSVDTEKFKPEIKEGDRTVTIGWIGSHTTTKYLEGLRDVFRRLSLKHQFKLKIIGAAGREMRIAGIEVINKDWNLEDEIEEFRSLDIGVYPLPDNEWTSGKTGFKTIQYMSVGIPSVVSDAKPNRVMVEDGINGFLVRTDDEWVARLSGLIEDPALRKKIGGAGRRTVVARYSLEVNAPKTFEIIRKVHTEKREG